MIIREPNTTNLGVVLANLGVTVVGKHFPPKADQPLAGISRNLHKVAMPEDSSLILVTYSAMPLVEEENRQKEAETYQLILNFHSKSRFLVLRERSFLTRSLDVTPVAVRVLKKIQKCLNVIPVMEKGRFAKSKELSLVSLRQQVHVRSVMGTERFQRQNATLVTDEEY